MFFGRYLFKESEVMILWVQERLHAELPKMWNEK